MQYNVKLIFILFLINNTFFSQENILGNVDYVYRHKIDTIKDSRISKGNFRLQWSEKNTYIYNLDLLKSMENITKQLKAQDSNSSNEKIKPHEFTVFNFISNVNEFYDKINVWYKTKEIINISWQLTNEEKTFLNYKCQKAIGEFKGRTYEAWFTTEIPLPIAPWKLKGLPGAVLYAVDKTGSVEFSATSVNTNPTENIVEIPNYVEQVTSEKYKEIKENYFIQLNANFTVKKNGEDFKASTQKKKKPTNPIELSN